MSERTSSKKRARASRRFLYIIVLSNKYLCSLACSPEQKAHSCSLAHPFPSLEGEGERAERANNPVSEHKVYRSRKKEWGIQSWAM